MSESDSGRGLTEGYGLITTKELATLTDDRVNKYLASKDMERPCEACGHGEWEIEGVDAETRRTHVVAQRLIFGKSNYFVYLPMSCANCGNTRFINVSYIFKGLAKMEVDDGHKQ